MNVFQEILAAVTKRPVTRPKMGAAVPKKGNLDEAAGLAPLSLRSTRPPIEFAPPGPKLRWLATNGPDGQLLKGDARRQAGKAAAADRAQNSKPTRRKLWKRKS
jgi:hypothetical protein